ncbi:MAG: tRNA (adenosine(37)-N6)-threonylcarbamoyltransferase complex dimerization subunit type 1 TsaB [Clostridiales bacterium]|jgi:tRNA threonylcarbamoyladenosine biosynthesis protein TsaB|nr:tRNA (adenosine(37)-N6)-threonylcarbamoyltransferase complex dimerization subunit type 1 TsaB [Clostridiales bacterium]
MTILAVDSSTNILDCAILRDGAVVSDGWSDDERTHSERVMPMVSRIFREADMTPRDIDVFVATTGPGSYTGVRIGVATVLGLAYGAGKRAMGVSTLELMAKAQARRNSLKNGIILPIIDARRGAVFTSAYRLGNINGDSEKLTEIEAPRRIDLEEWRIRLSESYPTEPLQWAEPSSQKWAGLNERDLREIKLIYLGGSV